MQFKELVFNRDIANWCVYRCNDVGSADLIVVSFYDFMSTHDYFYEFFDFIKPCPYRSLQASQK